MDIFIPYVYDDRILNILKEQSKRGVDIRMFVSKRFLESDAEIIEDLQASGIVFYYFPKASMHTKMIEVDNRILFIGSINFSMTSLDENKEI